MPDDRFNPAPKPPRAPSMSIALRTLVRTLRHGYDNLGTLAMISLLWFVGALLIVPLGSVTAALHRVTQPMTEERAANWRTFFLHLRADFRWSSLLVVVLMAGFILLQVNLSFYTAATITTLRILGILFLTLLIIWSGVTLFAFPMALRQHDQNLRTTLRNALLMVFANAPGVLISLVLLVIVTIILVVLPPLFVVLPGMIALWGEENTRMLLVASGYIAKDEFADREHVKG